MIRGWKEEIEGGYLEFLRARQRLTPAELAARFNVSECFAIYWLTQLAREGRVRICSVEVLEEGETPCGELNALSCRRKAYCPVEEMVHSSGH